MIHPPALNARHISLRTRNLRHTTASNNAQHQQSRNASPPHPDLNHNDNELQQQAMDRAHLAHLQELRMRREELERQEQEYHE
jgi:hypothetical protein